MKKFLFSVLLLASIGMSAEAQKTANKADKKVNTTATPVLEATVTAPVQELQAQPAAPADVSKVISFTNENYSFGKIPYGKPVEYEVTLKNISKDSVRIENVQVGCGCTTPKWKAGPYAAGESFKVTLGFNGATKGAFQKQATIFFNNGLSKVVVFSGETYEVPADAAPASPAQKMKAGK